MDFKLRKNYARSPPLQNNDSHNYVNLSPPNSSPSKASYRESAKNGANNRHDRPIGVPKPANRDSFEMSSSIDLPFKSKLGIPQNWYSPRSSIGSDSRPLGIVGHKANETPQKIPNKIRPLNPAGMVVPSDHQRLKTIDEDCLAVPIDKLLELCVHRNEDLQANALGYLQHLTFNNLDIKLQVRDCNGLPIIVSQMDSVNNYVARAALGVLKNMSFTDLEMITTDMERLGAIHKLAYIIDSTEDITQKELSIDVLWNLSVKYNLKPIILTDVVQSLVTSVIIPDSNMIRQDAGNYVEGEYDIMWSTMLRNALGIIRNVSYESNEARITLREIDGLVDCILYIIFKSGNRETEEDQENQIALIDSKIVENCVCILRNLTYAIQEIIDPDYFEKRRNIDLKTKRSAKAKTSTDHSITTAPPPTSGIPMGHELLWNSKYIVTALVPILKNGANAVTLEAAAGVVQNLTAGDWAPSREMQIQFRLQLALPTLIELIDFGTNEVIRSAATALRNLVQEEFSCMLVGKNGLQSLTEKIPMSSRSKRIDSNALAAILSTIYVIIREQIEFMKDFVTIKGANRCLYVRDLNEYVVSEDPFPEKIKEFSQCILDLLWKTPSTQEMLKKNNIKQSVIHPSSSNNRSAGGASPEDDRLPSQMRYHDSMVSNQDAHYPKDERYLRDSLAEIVSNSGLRDRNSKAYTISSIPGYGDVRYPAGKAKAPTQSGRRTSENNDHRMSSLSVINSEKSVSQSQSIPPNSRNKTSRAFSPPYVSANNSRVLSNNRRESTDLSRYSKTPRTSRISQNNNEPHSSRSNTRKSKSSDGSKHYDYEYPKAMKKKQQKHNIP